MKRIKYHSTRDTTNSLINYLVTMETIAPGSMFVSSTLSVKTDSTWRYITYVCLSILFCWLLYRGYNLFQMIKPIQIAGQTISLPNVQSQIAQIRLEQELFDLKLTKVKKVDNFIRYDHAKYLDHNVQFFNRYANTRNLTMIYEKLQEISSTSQLTISSFIIKNDSIQIKWEVWDMQVMYGTPQNPWLIKKFSTLKFLDNIDIPYYRKNGDVFEFTLVAMIKNASQPTSGTWLKLKSSDSN